MNIPVFRRSLLHWFARAKRPMPWRKTRDAYAIWVSEMMLQQTTVATVIPYYERFMDRFPNVMALAASDEDAVLSLWSGLGYYSRARNLRAAARVIVDKHDGRFPRTLDEALTLPGVGPYTAAAVTSMAYANPAAVVDGNVRRVLSRLHARRALCDRTSWERAQELLAPRSPGAWNEAMMELGATICTPRKPACARCPVAAHCLGRERPEFWSEGKPRREVVAIRVQMALVLRAGRILLTRNPPGDLMGGLYELPHSGMPRKSQPQAAIVERYRGVIRFEPRPLVTVRHAVTHHRIAASILKGKLEGKRPPLGLTFHPMSEVLSLPLGGLTRKALRAVQLTLC